MSAWTVWFLLVIVYCLLILLVRILQRIERRIARIEHLMLGIGFVQSAQIHGLSNEEIVRTMEKGMERAREEMKFQELAERAKPRGLKALWLRITRQAPAFKGE